MKLRNRTAYTWWGGIRAVALNLLALGVVVLAVVVFSAGPR